MQSTGMAQRKRQTGKATNIIAPFLAKRVEHPSGNPAYWPAVALAYPNPADVGGSGSPQDLPEPSCASPTDCSNKRSVHVSSCFGGNTGGGGGAGGTAGAAGAAGAAGSAGSSGAAGSAGSAGNAGNGGSGVGGSSSLGGASGNAGQSAAPTDSDLSGGCGCRSAPQRDRGAAWLLLAAAALAAKRRRR